MLDQRSGVANAPALSGRQLAPLVTGLPQYKQNPNANILVLGCNSACPLPNGAPNLTQSLHNALGRGSGSEGATAGTNAFAFMRADGTVRVAPDASGITWRTYQEGDKLSPNMSAVGGYTIYGTPSQGFFQQSFSKQLDKNLSGGTPGLGDWLPFIGMSDSEGGK